MERVVFLLEESGERIGCLLNPESVAIRRQAGLRPRGAGVGGLAGANLADEPLLFTGGGRTEIDLDLLFDVALAGSSIRTDDVRELTAPLWNLAENQRDDAGYGRPARLRFVWGREWNVPAVVAAVAERLERFSPGGAPARSWLRMKLLRAPEPGWRPERPVPPPPEELGAEVLTLPGPEEPELYHRVVGGDETAGGERLDHLAHRYCGDPSWWRVLARVNGIFDPLNLEVDLVLRVPSSILGGAK